MNDDTAPYAIHIGPIHVTGYLVRKSASRAVRPTTRTSAAAKRSEKRSAVLSISERETRPGCVTAASGASVNVSRERGGPADQAPLSEVGRPESETRDTDGVPSTRLVRPRSARPKDM